MKYEAIMMSGKLKWWAVELPDDAIPRGYFHGENAEFDARRFADGLNMEALVEAGIGDKLPEPMTIERAVQVLNERKHSGADIWIHHPDLKIVTCYEPPFDSALSEFTTIAIAEKYERDNPERTVGHGK